MQYGSSYLVPPSPPPFSYLRILRIFIAEFAAFLENGEEKKDPRLLGMFP